MEGGGGYRYVRRAAGPSNSLKSMIKKAPAKRARTTGGAAVELAAVEAYLAGVPEPARSTLEAVREAIRSAVPADATECISYCMPAFRYQGVLVSYAAFKDHCSFFPMSAAMLDDFAEEVKGYRTAKGTLQFPLDKPLAKTLVKKLVGARVVQNKAKALARKTSKGR